MDPPLPPPPLSSTTTTTTTTNPNITPLGYPESVDSSPRSRNTDSWDEPLPPIPGGAKLRLMCSYGGHIVPRPHDKSLCYLGGDTRIIVVDRHSSLSDLSLRLSRSLLNGRSFTLKYQLPNEDLDSLISVTTDEDLDNMIEEYDRTSSASLKPSRLRLFLFLSKPESASSMGSLLDDSKSESWFVDALNGSAGNLPRGLSADAASVNCLLGLDEVVHVNRTGTTTTTDVETQNDSLGNINKQVKHGQDVQSVPDSPMMETSSSFGSTSSSPSMSNLPPIRVHVEDQRSGFEEQFSQMSIAASAAQKQQDEGFVALSSPPPPLPTTIISGIPSNSASAAVVNENPNRGYSDDERSDYGVPTGFRKPPQPPQSQQLQQKPSGGVDLQSPDGGGRDISRSKPMYYQEQTVQQVGSRVSANPVDPKRDVSDPSYRIPVQQVQDSGYVSSSPFDQQQFIHGGTHYIQHHPSGQVPMSYYPVYLPQQQQPQQQLQQQQLQQQQQQQQQQQHQQQLDQQYHPSMYFLPVHQTQSYNVAVQSNLNETAKITSSRPPTPPTPTMISNAVSYKEPGNSPVYPPRSVPPPKPELTQSVYRTATAGAPHLIHTPSDQHQQQYMSYHQMHHQSQSIAAAPANYGYEYTDSSQAQMYSDPSHGQMYSDPSHAQIYYTQPLGSILPSQYQTMNAAQAVAAVSEASAQMPTDNMKQQQQIRTSQPL